MCFSNDVQTMEIPRRRSLTAAVTLSSASGADEMRRGSPVSRPVNRQLELPGQQIRGRLRSPLSASSPSRVSCLYFVRVA